MSRSTPDDDALPTPADYLELHSVAAICKNCERVKKLDLAALIAAGHGHPPLIKLPLKCSGCGSCEYRIAVGGR